MSLGPGVRYGLLLGTLRQIDARAGSCSNDSSSTPNNRDNASGTTFNFPVTCFTVKSKVLKCNSPTSKHIGSVLHVLIV